MKHLLIVMLTALSLVISTLVSKVEADPAMPLQTTPSEWGEWRSCDGADYLAQDEAKSHITCVNGEAGTCTLTAVEVVPCFFHSNDPLPRYRAQWKIEYRCSSP